MLDEQLPAHRERIEDQLQREAHRDADDDLLNRDDDALRARTASTCGGGTSGATISVIAPARTTRTRGGTNCAPNTGATMKHAPMRMNGQRYWASQASSWPVVR